MESVEEFEVKLAKPLVWENEYVFMKACKVAETVGSATWPGFEPGVSGSGSRHVC